MTELTPEEAEALRQMQEECSATLPDRRSEGDPQWLANGAQIELFGLQSAQALNGQTAEIIGFDDEVLRYRVRLHSDCSVKVVAKKNIRLMPPAEPVRKPLQIPVLQEGGSIHGTSEPSAASPTRDMVQMAIESLQRETAALNWRCQVRDEGRGGTGTADISEVYLRLNTAAEAYTEVWDLFKAAGGHDEELESFGNAALESYEACVERYSSVRSWSEMAQDEWNLTQHSVRKHGLLGTLKNEFLEVGKDVAVLGQEAGGVIRSGSQHVPQLVRSATGAVGMAIQTSTNVAATAATTVAERSQRTARHVVEEQIVAPVKRAWHLVLTAFLLCFLVPLFGLRTYAPLNSVVSNLGLIYGMVCLVCPPRGVQRRASKAALLFLYPVVTVAFPLALHYWLTHPDLPSPISSCISGIRSLPWRTWSSKLVAPLLAISERRSQDGTMSIGEQQNGLQAVTASKLDNQESPSQSNIVTPQQPVKTSDSWLSSFTRQILRRRKQPEPAFTGGSVRLLSVYHRRLLRGNAVDDRAEHLFAIKSRRQET